MKTDGYALSINNGEAHALGFSHERFTTLLSIVMDSLNYEDDDLLITSLYHDLGKHLVPSTILTKPEKLTSLEFELIKTHTTFGCFLLEEELFQEQLVEVIDKYQLPIKVVTEEKLRKNAAEIALLHHEKWDGSGYPYGLVGSDIPLYVQIVSITDVIDALFSKRPYKDVWGPAQVYEYLTEQKNKHFSAEVVNRVLQCYEKICKLYGFESDEKFYQLDTYF